MEEKYIGMWNKCLQIIRDNLPEEQYKTWFAPTRVKDYSDDTLVLQVPTQFYAEQLDSHYLNLMSSALHRVFGERIRLKYSFNVKKGDPHSNITEEEPHKTNVFNRKPVFSQPDNGPINPFAAQERLLHDVLDPQLNPTYTFENYCESKSNNVAFAIAYEVATKPQLQTFNPLFVFGPTGVGKTHLIQAVGIKMKECRPESRVLYISARTFESQFTTAVKNNTVNDFINFYESIDMLIVDDVQEFARKTATQNTFFHIFNHLHNKQRHLILSSDCPPSELDGMEARLLSRFKWGTTVELSRPDLELRKSVFLKKAHQAGVNVPMEIVDYVAENVVDNVRELEGVFASLIAYATVLNQPLSLDLARNVLSNSVKINKKQITFDLIAETVCSQYTISTDLLYSKTRKREVADSRQLVMALAKKYTKMSSPAIGAKLNRNHATVLYACKAVEERLSVDKDFRNLVARVEQAIL